MEPLTLARMASPKSSFLDKVLGLESGADDYVAKPYEPRELLARSKAGTRPPRHLEIVTTAWDAATLIGLGVPLYLVTMAPPLRTWLLCLSASGPMCCSCRKSHSTWTR